MNYLYIYSNDFGPKKEVRHGRKNISMKTMLKEAEGREFVGIYKILDETFGRELHFIDNHNLKH